MSADISGCHNWASGEGAIGMQWVGAREVDQHPTMHRAAPQKMIWSQMSTVLRLRTQGQMIIH